MGRSEQLEREAERTRTNVASTLTELRERLRPGQLTDDVLSYAGGQTGQLLETFGKQVAKNPVPALLIGAGIAWLLFGNRQNGAGRYEADADQGAGASNGKGAIGRAASSIADGAADLYEGARETVGDISWGVRDTARAAARKASDLGDNIAETGRQAGDAITEQARRAASATAQGAEDAWAFLKDQPLLLMGIGIALGSAIGTALPRTKFEDRLVGDTSDKIKDKADTLVAEGLSAARDVGEQVLGAAASETKSQLSGDSSTRQPQEPQERYAGDETRKPLGGWNGGEPDGESKQSRSSVR